MIEHDVQAHRFRTPGGHPIRMAYRVGTNDWNTLWSSLNEDEYVLPHDLLTGTALDIGGYAGSVGIALAIDNPELHVVIVEPVPPNCVLIRRNILQNRVEERVTLLEGAVGHGKVTVSYGYRGNEAAEHHAFVGNSTLAYDNGQFIAQETVEYDGLTLTALVLSFGPIVYMKIDTEGAEWDFLDDPAVAAVPVIVGEWHPTGHSIGDLIALLPDHEITFTGPQAGPGGFRAVLR